jgi:hypothetical protein
VCASFLHAPFCKTTILLNVAIKHHVQHVAHGPSSCTLQTLLQHFNIFVAFVQPPFGHVIFVDIEGGCQRAMNMLCLGSRFIWGCCKLFFALGLTTSFCIEVTTSTCICKSSLSFQQVLMLSVFVTFQYFINMYYYLKFYDEHGVFWMK